MAPLEIFGVCGDTKDHTKENRHHLHHFHLKPLSDYYEGCPFDYLDRLAKEIPIFE